MIRIAFPLLLALSLAPVLCRAAESNVNLAKAIAKIEKLGGKVTRDENSPGSPIIDVDLSGSDITDGGLADLKRLAQLQSLNLRAYQGYRCGVDAPQGNGDAPFAEPVECRDNQRRPGTDPRIDQS